MTELTTRLLMKLTRATIDDAERCLEPIKNALQKYEINTPKRVAAFLATIAVESINLSKFEEGLYYKDPLRVATIFKRVFDFNKDGRISDAEISNAKKYTKNPKELSKILYQGFHGRGPIQITWEKNYRAFSDDTGIDVISNLDLLVDDLTIGFESAGWFWYVNGCNDAADSGSMKAVTRIVNGPALMHLSERTALYNAAVKKLV